MISSHRRLPLCAYTLICGFAYDLKCRSRGAEVSSEVDQRAIVLVWRAIGTTRTAPNMLLRQDSGKNIGATRSLKTAGVSWANRRPAPMAVPYCQ